MLNTENLLIMKEQVVEKSTMCANCVHFDGDATKNLEEWRPAKEAMIQRIKDAIKLFGVQLPGFRDFDAGQVVAEMTRDGKMDVPTAIKTIEQQVLAKALAIVGSADKLYMADERYAIIAATDRDIASGKIGKCTGDGVDGNNNSLRGFRVFSGYHCHNWSGRAGWSIAHDGRPLDPLPGELMERAEDKAVKADK